MSIRGYLCAVVVVFALGVGATWLIGPREETIVAIVPASAVRGGPIMALTSSGEYLSIPDGPLSARICCCHQAQLRVRRGLLMPDAEVLDALPAPTPASASTKSIWHGVRHSP